MKINRKREPKRRHNRIEYVYFPEKLIQRNRRLQMECLQKTKACPPQNRSKKQENVCRINVRKCYAPTIDKSHKKVTNNCPNPYRFSNKIVKKGSRTIDVQIVTKKKPGSRWEVGALKMCRHPRLLFIQDIYIYIYIYICMSDVLYQLLKWYHYILIGVFANRSANPRIAPVGA